MSILLEVLAGGLDAELRDLLSSFYWKDGLGEVDVLRAKTYHDPPQVELDLDLGLSHWRECDLLEARKHLARACYGNLANSASHAALGCVCDELDDSATALEHFRMLNRLEPNSPAVQFAMGFCYERLAQPVSAAIHYHQSVSLDQNFLPARRRLAAVTITSGNPDEAVRQYEAICRLVPEETRLRTLLGELFFFVGRYDQAIEMFESAIVMEPDNWILKDDQIARWIAQGDIRQAIDKTHQALEQQGPFADLYLRLGNLYSLIGDDGPAMENYLHALEYQDSYLDAWVKLATHHLLFGRWEESAEAFAKAAELNDWLLVNYLGMGVAQASAGRMEQAGKSLGLATEIEPNGTLLHAQMIRLHWKLAVTGRIIDHVDSDSEDNSTLDREKLLRDELQCHAERVACEPKRAEARFHYGVLLRSAGRLHEATRQFISAVKLHPTFVPALGKLGVSLKELGREKQAAKIFHKIFQPDSRQIEFHYRLGIQFRQRGRLNEIARQMAQSDSGDLTESDARAALGLSLMNMGLLDRNAAAWQELNQTHRVGT